MLVFLAAEGSKILEELKGTVKEVNIQMSILGKIWKLMKVMGTFYGVIFGVIFGIIFLVYMSKYIFSKAHIFEKLIVLNEIVKFLLLNLKVTLRKIFKSLSMEKHEVSDPKATYI